MEDIECIYWGLFLIEDIEDRVFHEVEIDNKHVTYGFRRPCPANLLGQLWNVEVVGYGRNDRVEAYKVELPFDAGYAGADVPHITLSRTQDARPVESKDLDFYDLPDTFSLMCRVGYFGYDNIVHFD